ncbi:hypothetical protein BZARG_2637 [Bizionia argentinensis JUB59]|uniref:Uncharacterized protein n=1 Tax=Bizionia argentinensis JUB59 TaxID=1046627 RepID=G2ED94_9FLAO|nr:hypothetical protein [Bizionia argentinensis]EGV43615.1 hypothetical protein BZARG_2637 [Bizionia argentinensis JUB59]
MTNKQQIISAIKEMNIEKLERLLDDNRSYMDVTKQLFLKTLKQQFDHKKENKIFSFDKIIPGICNTCNKGCAALTFITDDNCALNLFFEENDDRVTDIYLCNDLKHEEKITPRYAMYFEFYEDEKVNFTPSIEFLIKKQKIEYALSDFEKFNNKTILIEDIEYWGTKHRELLESFSTIPFMNDYKQFELFQEFSTDIKQVLALIEKHEFAKQAISEFKTIESEKELVYWLLTYQWSNLSLYGFNRLEGWKESNLITYKNKPSIIIDCSSYPESLEFSYHHGKHEEDLINKYEPTPEHFKIAKKGITYSLESHLRAHGMYLDILPEEKNI